MRSSLIPSLRYSFSGIALPLTNGRTAIDCAAVRPAGARAIAGARGRPERLGELRHRRESVVALALERAQQRLLHVRGQRLERHAAAALPASIALRERIATGDRPVERGRCRRAARTAPWPGCTGRRARPRAGRRTSARAPCTPACRRTSPRGSRSLGVGVGEGLRDAEVDHHRMALDRAGCSPASRRGGPRRGCARSSAPRRPRGSGAAPPRAAAAARARAVRAATRPR